MDNNQNNYKIDEEENINIRQIIDQYLHFWKWFLLCIIISFTGAYIYLKYAQKQYQVTAKILLNEKENASGELAALAEVNPLVGNYANGKINDQIEILKSRRLIEKVIINNNLNITYEAEGKLKNTQIAESESPFKVIFLKQEDKLNENLKATFNVKVISNQKFILTDLSTGKENTHLFSNKIINDFGNIIISPNYANLKSSLNKTYLVKINSIENTVTSFQGKTQISPNNEKTSNIINLSQTSGAPKVAALYINQLIDQYNKDLIEDDSKLLNATILFINERLHSVNEDLVDVDSNLQNFKTSNSITDIQTEANLFLQNVSESEKQLLDFATQLQLIDYMSGELSGNKSNLLPSNIGLQDQTIANQINSYNQLILTKEDMLKSVTINHPHVLTLDEQINDIKRNLKSSLNIYRNNIQTNVNAIKGKISEVSSRISKIPQQETSFKNISREQKIIESLYLFLLEKREENEIKAASTPEHIKVIDSAFINKTPVSPKNNIIYLGSIIIGLIIPFAVIYIYKLLDNRVTTKEEVEAILNIPIAGQIPRSESDILKTNDNSVTAEAFRMLRTNINFFINNDDKRGKSIFVTSTTSNEGKSFTSINLSQILSMSGKKVLLIGADIRNPKVLDHLNIKEKYRSHLGITEFLVSNDISMSDIIIKDPAKYKFDVVSSGQIAPNPSELLMNGKFNQLIEFARNNYDYVIIDTAPVGLVTDTLLISDNADLTLYLVRANYIDKRLLSIPKEIYNEKRIKNMALVINDVKITSGYYYNYSYGYGYGHNNSNLPWYKKLKRKLYKS